MVSFLFRVNRSFLEYAAHPITVPSSQVDYARIRSELLCGDATIVLPNGERIAGVIYCGTAGYGPYYQLRMRQPDGESAQAFQAGDLVRVDLARRDGAIEAFLAPA